MAHQMHKVSDPCAAALSSFRQRGSLRRGREMPKWPFLSHKAGPRSSRELKGSKDGAGLWLVHSCSRRETREWFSVVNCVVQHGCAIGPCGCNALQCSREPLEYRGKELEQDTVQCSRAERKAALQQRVDAVDCREEEGASGAGQPQLKAYF